MPAIIPQSKERLLTCPHCGQSGFLNLAHHRCKANSSFIPHPSSFPHSPSTLLAAYHGAQQIASEAVRRALICGIMLAECKSSLPFGQFESWLAQNCPEIPARTARHWMSTAERIINHLSLELVTPREQLPYLSQILTTQEPLSEEDAETRQIILDFIAGKTMREALASCTVDGEDPALISRVANADRGGEGDRKAFDQFIGRSLRVMTTHFSHWDAFTPGQADTAKRHLESAVDKWPTPVLEAAQAAIRQALKNRPA